LVKGNEKWENGQQEDYTDLTPELKKLLIKTDDYNDYVGL